MERGATPSFKCRLKMLISVPYDRVSIIPDFYTAGNPPKGVLRGYIEAINMLTITL